MSKPGFLDLWIYRLDPMRAEVRLRLSTGEGAGELRGRLMGPRSRFATTIEIAYPFRPAGPPGEYAAIVPEPSLWQPAKPFCYEGPIEKLDADGNCEAGRLQLCFRTIKLGAAGLLLNGKPLTLRGKEAADPPSESELLQWRGEGCNAVLIDIVRSVGDSDLTDLAMSLGFLILLKDDQGLFCQTDAPGEAGQLRLPGVTRQGEGVFIF